MAYDKAVDSVKLEAALMATADSIRGKTGSSAALNWNDTTGFAADVNSIDISSQSKTVTPSAGGQTVVPDNGYKYLDKVTVEGDSNLAAENIAEGVSIFGVEGTLAAGTRFVEGSFSGKYLTTYTCSELPFKPSRLIFFSPENYNSNRGSSNYVLALLLSLDTGSPMPDRSCIMHKNLGGSDDSRYYCKPTYVDYSPYLTITMTDNGFTIAKNSSTSAYVYLTYITTTVYWIAFE